MDKILNVIKNSSNILLLTHKNPDTDTIASAVSFSIYLDNIGKKYKLFNIEKLPLNLDFLKNYNKFSSNIPKNFDLAIFFDTADEKRVGVELNLDNINSICFDHHISNTKFANFNIIDSSSDSTAKVVADFFIKNNIKITKDMANALLAGMYDDSKGFSLDRVDKDSFEIAKILLESGAKIDFITRNLYKRNSLAKYRLKVKVLNSLELFYEGKIGIIKVEPIWLDECCASIEEADDFIDEVLNLAIVEVAVMLRIKNNKIRGSFRSKNIDVSKIAQKLNGGGHKKAAGFSLDLLDFNIAKIKILELFKGVDFDF